MQFLLGLASRTSTGHQPETIFLNMRLALEFNHDINFKQLQIRNICYKSDVCSMTPMFFQHAFLELTVTANQSQVMKQFSLVTDFKKMLKAAVRTADKPCPMGDSIS